MPKGKDNLKPRELLQEYLGVELPDFDTTRKITIATSGYDFTSVKARDIPGFLQRRLASIGALGNDLVEESEYELSLINQAGSSMSRIALLSPEEYVERWRRDIGNPGMRSTFEVVTRTPRLLGKIAAVRCLPLRPSGLTATGSEEGMPELTGIQLVTAQVASGETARENGVDEVMNLYDVYAGIYEGVKNENIY